MIKKMIAIILLIIFAGAFTALITPAFGSAECNQTVYVSKNSAVNYTFTDCSFWVISNNQRVIGKKAPNETVSILPPQSPAYKYVCGCADTGLIREKAGMRAVYGESLCGFTSVNAVVTIKPEYYSAVENVVINKLNEYDLTANKIIACTMWWDGNTVAHIFFTSISEKVAVGSVTLNNGKDAVILYMGDFDGDGSMELGFTAGWNTETRNPEPSPSPNASSKSDSKGCCKKGCVIQINILSIVNNCFKAICD